MRLNIVLDEYRTKVLRTRAKRKGLPIVAYARSVIVAELDDPQERQRDAEWSSEIQEDDNHA